MPVNPSEIARQTLKLLLSRRVSPTPENYYAIYNEIAEPQGVRVEIFPENELKALLDAIPVETFAQQRLRRDLDETIRNKDWNAYKDTLAGFIGECGAEPETLWSELVGELIRQWDARQAGLTSARKREALEHVLSGTAKNNELLYTRLQNLVKSWSLEPDDTGLPDLVELSDPLEPPHSSDVASTSEERLAATETLIPEFRDMLAYTLEVMLFAQIADVPELAAQTQKIAEAVRAVNNFRAVQDVLAAIKRLAFQLEFLAEDRNGLRESLVKLLRVMVENANELVLDDKWMSGQLEVVRDIMSRPLSIRAVDDAEQRLREVLFRQSQLKHSLLEARESLKHMLAGFVDHLAEFAESTSDYHDKIEACAKKISQADDITKLENVIADVMRETRIIQLNAQRSRDDLRLAKQNVDAAQKRIDELQNELEKTSELVRHDHLTGAINRKGMNEILKGEIARSRRRRSPACLSFLDIDNFKKLNDQLGHATGDAALVHFAAVIRETIRPHDTLARYGGEEFVIVLPDTPLEEAEGVLVRLQRELTKHFFLNNNEKVLITFSAGVTEIRDGDDEESVVKRADGAMYQAKQTGKNRVVRA
ncbi:MAG: GGDEF domain-containing protein [Candidatus Accumulibacter sp.]|jgi:diguanylate cyclase|nr:GGDEF domain-containing protein [Accumulibacter sp.]